MNRKEFAYRNIQKNWRILEIAPYHSPLYPKREGYKTEIVDVFDRGKLLEKAKKDPMIDDWSRIEEVDYIASSDYARIIGKLKYYDLIAASHVIEHTTDIIAFLNDCSQLLKDDGLVRLFIPDKRYDFDCFRECATTRVAIDTHMAIWGGMVHSPGTIAEAQLRTCIVDDKSTYIANSGYAYLNGDMNLSVSGTLQKFNEVRRSVTEFDEEKYLDVHSWVVTPKSFEIMIYELNELGFIDLVIDDIYTIPRAVEFFVDLKKGHIENDDCNLRLSLYIDRKKEALEEYEDAIAIREIQKLLKRGNEKPEIYVYGTGGGISRILRILESIKCDYRGFVVSDGMRDEESFNGHPVFELSEIDADSSMVLMGVEKQHFRNEIITELNKRNFKVFF